ncbi:MAG TPA: O-antigen translocase [Lacibacter sp.]|nr:O-antigen translocase [Lacibacter sp.]HMO90221.1 O-antigen translocase [Lacibacter sp.]
MEKTNSYKQIIKATGIFGGVQVFNILLTIIRSKVVAVLLGTAGVGLMGMFSATTSLIASISNLGIGFSAVRTVSEAAATDNRSLISRTIITLRRWAVLTGLGGALITLVLAPQLSAWTFGNDTYTWAFVWLSATLFFQALTSGELALLQGMRRLQHLAKANVMGSVCGLLVSLPLYYWLGVEGIVPALIATAAITLLLAWLFSRNIPYQREPYTYRESLRNGVDMVKLGSVVMITGFAASGIMYLIRTYIGRTGGLEEVGLYAAAWAILNGYVDMIFTAMGTDYFPRLSAVHSDNKVMNRLVNEQAEIALLILGPILILMLPTLPLIIRILLTKEFLPVKDLIQWALIGMLFKAIAWSVAFTMLAKGDRKMFFISELSSNLFTLGATLLCYHYLGLEGIGIAFLLSYTLYTVLVLFIARNKYQFRLQAPLLRIFLVQLACTTAAFLVAWKLEPVYNYTLTPLVFLLAGAYSLRELNQRIQLSTLFEKIKSKFTG